MFGDFDDDLFGAPKQKSALDNSSYKVKFCSKEWYLDDDRLADSIDEEKTQILKFRADNAYSKADYLGALASYHRLLDDGAALPPQLAREVVESIGLSYLKLGESQQALQWGLKMWQHSRNKDHQMGTLKLLAQVYHQLKQHDNEILAYLEQLQSHPLAAFSWASFGEALTFYWGIPISEPMTLPRAIEASDGKPGLFSGLSEHTVRCLIGACFIRTRLIADTGTKHFPMNGRWAYERVLEKANHWINGFQLSEDFQAAATENMSRDVRVDAPHQAEDEQQEFCDLGKTSNTEMDPDNGDRNAMFATDPVTFYRKWFGWMDSYLAKSQLP